MIDVSYTETPQSCSNICQSIQECLWFTHDSATKGCYSLKDCIPVLDCPTCVSGEVNCPYEKGMHQNQFPLLSRFLPFSVLFPVCVVCFPSSLKQGQCLEKSQILDIWPQICTAFLQSSGSALKNWESK